MLVPRVFHFLYDLGQRLPFGPVDHDQSRRSKQLNSLDPGNLKTTDDAVGHDLIDVVFRDLGLSGEVWAALS